MNEFGDNPTPEQSNPEIQPTGEIMPEESLDLASEHHIYEADMPATSEVYSLQDELDAVNKEIQELRHKIMSNTEQVHPDRMRDLILHKSEILERLDPLRAGRTQSIKRHPANPIEE